jgi:hypothetical protein
MGHVVIAGGAIEMGTKIMVFTLFISLYVPVVSHTFLFSKRFLISLANPRVKSSSLYSFANRYNLFPRSPCGGVMQTKEDGDPCTRTRFVLSLAALS